MATRGFLLGVVCAAAALAACAEYIAQGEQELVGEDRALAAALAARARGGRRRGAGGWLRAGGGAGADPLELSNPDHADAPPAEVALMEAALQRDTRRRQSMNYTHEGDEHTVVYKAVQLMFHAYYASQSRLDALRTVVHDIESNELFLMAYAFKKLEMWLAAAKTMYYQVVTEHNRETDRWLTFAAYEKFGTTYDSHWKKEMAEYLKHPMTWDRPDVPLYKSVAPALKWPHYLPYKMTELTEMYIHHQEFLVFRNYTLAAHLMVDVTYTCEFLQYLNERLRKYFRLDLDENPIT